LLFLLLPCCLLRPVLTGRCLVPADLLSDVAPWRSGNVNDLVPWNPLRFDGIAQFYPWRLFAAQTLKSGIIPLWNPHQFCGTPFLANSQSAVLYPLNLLFVIMPVSRAFGASAILHLFLTGAFLYTFMRRALGVSRAAATMSGIVWQLSTWQVSWLSLPSFLDTSAWLPLALLLAHRLAQKPSGGRAVALGGVLGLSLLAGHLQIGLYSILLTAAYAIYRSVAERVAWRTVLTCAVMTGGMLFLVAAPHLLPVMELSRQSHRAAGGGHPTFASFEGYNRDAMPVFNLITLLVPGFFGNPGVTGPRPGISAYWGATNYAENACYIGVAALLLATAGLLAVFRRGSAGTTAPGRFFAWAGLTAMLLALGTWLGAPLYFGLPGFGQTGSPARVLAVFTLSAAVLAGVGLDAVIGRKVAARMAIGAFAAFAVALVVGSLAALIAREPRVIGNIGYDANDFRLFCGLALAVVAVIMLHRRGTLTANGASAALIALAVLDLLTVNYGYNATVDEAKIYPVTPAIAWLKAHVGPGDRIMPVNRDWSIVRPPNAVLPPNAATVYGFDDLQGYDSLQTGVYKAFAGELDGHDASPEANGNIVFVDRPFSKLSELAGARWIITPPQALLVGAPPPVYTDAGCAIYEDSKAQPETVGDWNGEGGRVPPAPASFQLGLYFGLLAIAIAAAVAVARPTIKHRERRSMVGLLS
jgi:hypothetical protein